MIYEQELDNQPENLCTAASAASVDLAYTRMKYNHARARITYVAMRKHALQLLDQSDMASSFIESSQMYHINHYFLKTTF